MGLIDDYCVDSVTIKPRGTLDPDGTYDADGTPVSTTAKVSKASGLRKDADGKEYVYTMKMWFKSGETLALEYKVTFGGKDYEIRDIREIDDPEGTLSHYEVFLG